jgi:hypothetical protein
LVGWFGYLPALLLLVGVDRLEAWYQQPQPSWLAPIVLNALRIALILGFSLSDNLGFLDPTYLFVIIPFSVFLAGKSYGMTGLVWVLYLVVRVHQQIDCPETVDQRGHGQKPRLQYPHLPGPTRSHPGGNLCPREKLDLRNFAVFLFNRIQVNLRAKELNL